MEELVERVAPNALRVSVGDHLTLAFTGAPLLGEAELNFRKEGTLQFLSPKVCWRRRRRGQWTTASDRDSD
ncbi:hypothetical protein [Sulfodiicoccus acidiphilus]|uniref:hypothetical protein n=1 Tax=Sulfodiicoccus acidiphilus TaxID=1670455 RepID=UPI000F81F396|nr:hypothetical protein [Sulfodiicoccus acidiphilus]